MPHTDFSFTCSPWLVRSFALLLLSVGLVLNIFSLSKCDFVEGDAVFYIPVNKTANEPNNYGYPDNGNALPEFPEVISTETFAIGAYKATGGEYGECYYYKNDYAKDLLEAGAAEGTARFFGTLGATFAGLSICILLCLALIPSEALKRIYILIVSIILSITIFCQILTFSVFRAKRCHEDYWKDFASEGEDVSVACYMGDGGYFSFGALFLYIMATSIVFLKWQNASCTYFAMEWTKDSSKDPPFIQPEFSKAEVNKIAPATTQSGLGSYTVPGPTQSELETAPLRTVETPEF